MAAGPPRVGTVTDPRWASSSTPWSTRPYSASPPSRWSTRSRCSAPTSPPPRSWRSVRCSPLPGVVLAVRRGLRWGTPRPAPGRDDRSAHRGRPAPACRPARARGRRCRLPRPGRLVPFKDAFFWPAVDAARPGPGGPTAGVAAPHRHRGLSPRPRPGAPRREHAVALLLCGAAAVWSLLLVRPDADDVYYLNRSVWVAAHDTSR